MKLHSIYFALMTMLSLTAILGCGDHAPPSVTIDSPVEGTTFVSGATISMSSTVTDDHALKEATFQVAAGSDDSNVLFTQPTAISGKKATVTATYVINLSNSDFNISIRAIDEDENEAMYRRLFHVN